MQTNQVNVESDSVTLLQLIETDMIDRAHQRHPDYQPDKMKASRTISIIHGAILAICTLTNGDRSTVEQRFRDFADQQKKEDGLKAIELGFILAVPDFALALIDEMSTR
jgi:hypothetical protein